MKPDFTRLQSLHLVRREDAQVLFVHEEREITWPQLLADVAALRVRLADSPARDWAVFEEQAYPFSVALLALLGSGRRLWLPANATAETAERLSRHCGGWLGAQWPGGTPVPIAQKHPAEALSPLSGEVVVFTSGSTGEPRAITKKLHQLDAEVASLEQLWGEQLGDAQILGTVSHQHIYGLLFRVLWPLCAGRTSHSEMLPTVESVLTRAGVCAHAAWVSSPAHLRRLENTAPWSGARSKLAAIFSSGGPLPAESATQCYELSGHWPVEVFGSSESGGIAWRTQADGNRLWTPLPGVETAAADDGRLQLRSPHLPDQQWLRMDDAITHEQDGRFSLGPRLDRIVKVEGKRLALPELEQCLEAHEWLSESRALLLRRRRETVAVVAVPSPGGQQALSSLGRHGFARQLRASLQAHFEPVTLPRLWRFVDQLPVNSQGKVSQQTLAALFERHTNGTMPPAQLLHKDAESAELRLEITPELACFEGHFRDMPIVPGMALGGWAEYHARQRLPVHGDFRRLQKLKFRRLVRPGQTLRLQLTYNQARTSVIWRFENEADGTICASGELVYE